MDKIRIRVIVATNTNRTSASKERTWKQIAYKLTDLWDNGNFV